MTLNLIGLGMNENSLTAEALEAIKQSDKIYLENYTVNFPYKIEQLEKQIKQATKSTSDEINKRRNQQAIKIIPLNRQQVESEEILKEASSKNISLLVYGDALSATTHIQLILAALKHSNNQTLKHCKPKVYHNASILTAVAETGLSLYKFGKTTSMPNWKEHTNQPKSFADIIKQNQSIQAHTLILTDIGLEISDAILELKETSKKENLKLPKKIIAISNAATSNQKIFYDTLDNLQNKKINLPFCLIIPTKLNHVEEEALETLKE